jgi:UDP-glucose 4-epimerase
MAGEQAAASPASGGPAGEPGRRRIAITGLSNFWGRHVAAALVQDPDVEQVFGIDVQEPETPIPGVELLKADVLTDDLAEVLRPTGIDTLVHNDVPQFPGQGRSARQIHEVNVIGTLKVLAGCERVDTLNAVVVRGSAAIYGSEPGGPRYHTEDLAGRIPLRTPWQRDVAELENLVRTYAKRHPEVTCTMLRLQPVVGTRVRTPITRILRLPVFPVFLGFDPLIQVLHESDSVDAIVAAVRRPLPGAVNIAGEGAVSLGHAARILGRPAVPLPGIAFGAIQAILARAGVRVTPDIKRYLRYGRVVNVRRMIDDLGFRPRYTTRGAFQAIAASIREGSRSEPEDAVAHAGSEEHAL